MLPTLYCVPLEFVAMKLAAVSVLDQVAVVPEAVPPERLVAVVAVVADVAVVAVEAVVALATEPEMSEPGIEDTAVKADDPFPLR